MKLVTAAQMRAIEAAAVAAGTSYDALMQTAGRAVAVAIRDRLGGVRARRVVILVGPGNNGGDGLVAARHLYDFGADVTVCLLAPRAADDPNLRAVRATDMEVIDHDAPGLEAALDDALDRADLVLDAVLGTGRQRPLDGLVARIFDRLQHARAPLVAVDLPTGVDADTGAADPHAAPAGVTLALGYSKIGLHVWPGSTYAGEVDVLDIGLDPALGASIATSLLTAAWARDVLPPRPPQSNKGTFGRVLVVAGSTAYTGAAMLAALGALRAGAGLVTLAAPASVRAAVASYLPEVTYLPLPEDGGDLLPSAGDAVSRALPAYDALLIGPGLGQSSAAQALVRGLLASPAVETIPTVIDADALNALAKLPAWHEALRCRAVLTPHPGELARLRSTSIAAVQSDRLAVARGCAETWRQTVVLKGAHTIVARPDGEALISPFANAALATAGTGDVLAGTIAALLAQDVPLFDAAGLGVHLHAAAATLHEADYGSSGLLANELAQAIARTAARLRRGD